MNNKPVLTRYVIFLVCASTTIGAINTIVMKGQSKVSLDMYEHSKTHSHIKYYNHPFLQTSTMFFAEFCCLIAYFCTSWRSRAKQEDSPSAEEKAAIEAGQKLHYNPLLFCMPAFIDVCGSTFTFVGILTVNASIMQLIMCTVLVWTAVFSCILLKRRYELFQYVGLSTLSTGVLIVALDTFWTAPEEGTTSGASPFGVICLILGSALAGLQMVVEEVLLMKYYVRPLMVVGLEGCAGLIIYSIALIVLYYIPCTTNTEDCLYGRIEDVPRALKEITSSWLLAFVVSAFVVTVSLYNLVGLLLTKYASATHRGAVMVAMPFAVWAICLAIDWETFFLAQLVGYLLAVYGMMVYYEMIPLKIWKIFSKSDMIADESGGADMQALKE